MSVQTKMPTTLYGICVKNLDGTVSEEDLKNFFSTEGEIASTRLIRTRGIGYVNFYSEAVAKAVTNKKEGFIINGVALTTEYKGPVPDTRLHKEPAVCKIDGNCSKQEQLQVSMCV